MAYVEATIIVDGAVEKEEVFGENTAEEFDLWLSQEKEFAMAHPTQRTEIYLLEHDHPPDVEDCSCVQYVTDHHPHWSWDKVQVPIQ